MVSGSTFCLNKVLQPFSDSELSLISEILVIEIATMAMILKSKIENSLQLEHPIRFSTNLYTYSGSFKAQTHGKLTRHLSGGHFFKLNKFHSNRNWSHLINDHYDVNYL